MSDINLNLGPRIATGTPVGPKPQPSAAAPTPSASASDSLATTSAPESQSRRLQRMQQDLAGVVAQAKFAKPEAGVEPPHLKMLESIYSPSWIFNTAEDQPPREMHGAADVLTRTPDKLGGTPEGRLRDAILAQKGPLEPADVLKLSLKVNGNDYFLASLTAHNLLKNATSTERRLRDKRPEDPALVAQDVAVINRLAPLRAPDSALSDEKMGPWYHTFGLATLDAGSKWVAGSHSDWLDRIATTLEHPKFLSPKTWNRLGNLISTIGFHTAPAEKLAHWLERRHPLGGADPEKSAIDQMAVNAFTEADKQHRA